MNQNETLLPLSDAVKLATGQSPHLSSLHRWRLRGISGVRLETTCVGGRRMTSVGAVRRFCDAIAVAKDGQASVQSHPETNRQAEARASRTDAGLSKHGV